MNKLTGLTHKQVESQLTIWMERCGYKRVKYSPANNQAYRSLRPDRIFKNKEKPVIVVEVKPEIVTKDEVLRGIGQSACYLPYNVKPYLVIPVKYYDELEKVFAKLPWLGIITYDNGVFDLRKVSNVHVYSYDPEIRRLEDQFLEDKLGR